MDKEFETILIERPSPHVMVLKFNRPERANAMNTQMGLDLRQVFLDLYVEDYSATFPPVNN